MKTGDEFTHRHWMDEANRKLRCRVTAVRRGAVYFRPVYKDAAGAETLGKAMCFDVGDEARWVAGFDPTSSAV